MRIENQPVVLNFIRLTDCARIFGATSVEQFVADLRTLTSSELREVGDIITTQKEG